MTIITNFSSSLISILINRNYIYRSQEAYLQSLTAICWIHYIWTQTQSIDTNLAYWQFLILFRNLLIASAGKYETWAKIVHQLGYSFQDNFWFLFLILCRDVKMLRFLLIFLNCLQMACYKCKNVYIDYAVMTCK